MRGKPGRFAVWAAAVFLCLGACRGAPEVGLPPELLGRWTTNAPKYADRYFELRDDRTVVFGLGGQKKDVSPIVRIELDQDGDYLNYHISHLSETGEPYIFSLSYHPGRSGQLVFLNQPKIVWKKESGRGSTSR